MGTGVQRVCCDCGGGSASLIHQASRTLTNDEFSNIPLFGGRIEIVPAPGLNRVLAVRFGILDVDTVAGAYTNVVDAAPQLFVGNTFVTTVPAGLPLDQQTRFAFQLIPIDLEPGSATFSSYVRAWGWLETNSALSLGDNFNSGAYANGDASNTASVYVEFGVYDFLLRRCLTIAESGWNADTRTFA